MRTFSQICTSLVRGESVSKEELCVPHMNSDQTVAHWAAMHYLLPDDFDNWRLTTGSGKSPTVAEVYLRSNGEMPESFNDWGLATKGKPLAHIAVDLGVLPKNFYNLDLYRDLS